MGDGRDDVIGKNEDSDSGDNFSSISMASQDQDQDQDSSPTTDDDSHQYQESDFEFGCVPPSSPTSDLNKSSPADVLFFNGRLLPHAFPSESSVKNNIGRVNDHRSHVSSRASSISSKDSLLSSRSNSRSSSCSSTGRTSSCENIEKRLLGGSEQPSDDQIATRRVTITRNQLSNRSIRLQSQVPNQRWQFIAPAPILTPTTSIPPRRKRGEILVPEELRSKKQVKNNKNKRSSTWFVPRLFRSFMSTCRVCHALEPSKRRENLS